MFQHQRTQAVAISLWAGAILGGFFCLETYKTTPGPSGSAPSVLAETTRAGGLDRPRLTMFVHPRCPCSRASLSALAEILARHPHSVTAEILFVKPPGVEAGWERDTLWNEAVAIPGLRVRCDEGASEAARQGAKTSGDVTLYSADGRLLFHGGITRSRGHEGESAGSHAIEDLIAGKLDAPSSAPVFGCPLLEVIESSARDTKQREAHSP